MALTRVQVETILTSRYGPKMAAAGMDTTEGGANPAVNDALFGALLAMGITPANPLSVTDSDLLAADPQELLERAELRLCESIAGNLDLVDIATGPRRESLSQLADQMEKIVSRLQFRLNKKYGDLEGKLSGGAISLDFAEKGDTSESD